MEMVTGKIKFTLFEDITEFVNTVSKFDADVDVRYNSITIDGKSIQGLYCIQMGKELTCTIHDELANVQGIIDSIQKYIVEDFKETK